MLMRRDQAPSRSPISFSNGGGDWKGSWRRISRSASAFGLRPDRLSFFASFAAWGVKTSRHPLHQSSDSRHSLIGVFSPFRMEARIPGMERRCKLS